MTRSELEKMIIFYALSVRRENLKRKKNTIKIEPDLGEVMAAVDEFHTQEVEKREALLMSDLAWCLGKLRGLGHPAESVETKHQLTPPAQQEKE